MSDNGSNVSDISQNESYDENFQIPDLFNEMVFQKYLYDDETECNIVQAVLQIKKSVDTQNKILKHMLEKLSAKT